MEILNKFVLYKGESEVSNLEIKTLLRELASD